MRTKFCKNGSEGMALSLFDDFPQQVTKETKKLKRFGKLLTNIAFLGYSSVTTIFWSRGTAHENANLRGSVQCET